MDPNPLPHGFDEDAATKAMLRSPPTGPALDWVARVTNADVVDWTVLRGGMSSAMYALNTADGGTVVLRCYVRPEVNEEEPGIVRREAAALEAATSVAVPTPRVVAVDPLGARVGVPALLMTWLPGRVVWDPSNRRRWLAGLAEVLPAVHQGDTSHPELGTYFNYRQVSYEPPAWANNRSAWERAIELFHGPVLDGDRSLIHRDFHPGNVLWRGGTVTGVVDWQSACVGPPSVDIGHCRANLLGYAPDAADAFTRLAERRTGRTFHPWADIAALIGMLDGLRTRPPRPSGRDAINIAIENAVAGLGRNP